MPQNLKHDIDVLSVWEVQCRVCKKKFHIHCRWDMDECLGVVIDTTKPENQVKRLIW